jgi:hypothetical protein
MDTLILEAYINNTILSPNYIYKDIKGAPFSITDNVKIRKPDVYDNTFENKYIGEKGVVIFFEYECGCCQSYPDDPMIGVQFPNGEVFEFWKEELIRL